MKITDEIKQVLDLPCNEFLTNDAEVKYNKFKNIDPFPDIENALLNGNDVAKYVLATGLLDPFKPDQLSGVTYTARFSGELYYWTSKGEPVHQTVEEGKEHRIPPNSITYLEIDTCFRVPNYMALRFNLRVKNVYKGLLLGTGPIIDSGFVGRIFIPLHNLTCNYYIIKKGAKLIEIEFTKLSKNINVQQVTPDLPDISKWDFSKISTISNNIIEERDFGAYIDKALVDPDFHVLDNKIYVSSANLMLEENIKNVTTIVESKLEDQAASIEEQNTKNANYEKHINEVMQENIVRQNQDLEKHFNEQKARIDASVDKSEQRENFIKTFSILSIVAMLFTAITMAITAFSYFSQSAEIKLAHQSVEQSIEINEQRIQDILIIINALEISGEIPEELSAKYNDMLQEIETEIDQLKEQRSENTKSYVIILTLFIIFILFSLLAIGLSIFFFIYTRSRLKSFGNSKNGSKKSDGST
ncbi:MAG: hypothetical protein HFK08_05930 [Clostridia bacterium]|nr:hypothetical protein [Clostridia bacterium]